MPHAINLRLRCFLEGREVPIVSASLSIQPDAPAQCQVQIPATDAAHEFLPRTFIQVFFYDFYDGPGDTLSVSVTNTDQVITADEDADTTAQDVGANSESEMDSSLQTNLDDDTAAPVRYPMADDDEEEDPEIADRRWKSYFTGEIIGYQFVKSHQQRAIILSCLDLSVYWDTCYQYQVNVASLTGNGTAHFVGAGTTLFDTFFQSSTSTIVDVVNRPSRSRPELTGLLSGVVHLLERVGGVYNSPKGFRGVNDFFSIAELKYHLIDMIAASEHDTSSQRLFPRRAFNQWSRGAGGRLGKIASFREILNHLNKFIFHNTIPNPMAKYTSPSSVEQTSSRSVTTSTTRRFTDTNEGRDILDRIESANQTLSSYAESNEQVRARGLSSRLNQLASSIRSIKDSVQPHTAEYGIASVHSELHRAGVAVRSLATALLSYEETHYLTPGLEVEVPASYQQFFGGAGSSNLGEAQARLASAAAQLAGGSATRTSRRTVTETETETKFARLNSQIIRPDIFMVAPPRCNVLFPELYHEVNFTRQFLREVTRMRLTVSDEIFGSDVLLNNVYYAPDVEVLGTRARQQRSGGLEGATLKRAAYARRLMDHELYTGPVPIFERMNEVNIAAARGRNRNIQFKGARVPYATRAANFQFFKNRWSTRTMSVTGRFNPYAACGFPAVVIDRYMTEEQVALSSLRGVSFLEEANEYNYPGVTTNADDSAMTGNDWSELDAWAVLRQTVPTQFVGLIMGLQHTVNQQSASTSYTLSTARTHRDNDELLSANRLSVARRERGQSTVQTTVASLENDPPQVGQLGPKYGLITEVTPLERSGKYILFGTFRSTARRSDVEVPVGLTQEASAYGPEVVTLIGSTTLEVTFKAYQITEEVDNQEEKVDVPLEDFLRPPWMSDVWRNDRIGAVYQQFFGTGAITDPITIDTGYSTNTSSDDAAHSDAERSARDNNLQEPIRSDGRTVQEAEMAITIERAIDLLLQAYSTIKHHDKDVNEFVRSYTWRPIADLIDLLGSRDLTINPTTGEVSGTEGFFSRAFGHGENGRNLRNLLPPDTDGRPVRRILGIETGEGEDRQNALVRLDKRADKSDRVLNYVAELYASKGLLG